MKLLLDTHALLWWLSDDPRLGSRARALIEDPSNDILASVVSLWEVVVKTRIGKMRADVKTVADAVQREGFVLLDISVAHLVALAALPVHHRDPFDHLLMAQAIAEEATFISGDQNVSSYPIQYVACSD